jgi:MazG family protein
MSRPQPRTLDDLLAIMARLRAPDGCPWDREQTHASILNCLVEEAYEFVDAVENGDVPNMKEELGDLLLQVVFHAQMAKEAGAFDFADVVEVISDKLVRRHPHVFGESKVDTAEGVQKQWDDIKAQEKGDAGESGPEAGPLGALPKHLPALLKAEKIQKRAARTGFDWADWKGPLDKVREELAELEAEADTPAESAPDARADRMEAEFGDLLFAAVNLGRHLKLDPEKALARANRKFVDRFTRMDALIRAEGKGLKAMELGEMDGYWERVKRGEAGK